MMEKPVGIRVFPSSKSPEIKSGSHILHYRIPPEEPPIDYTLREKPKIRADYRVVFPPVREHPDDYFGEISSPATSQSQQNHPQQQQQQQQQQQPTHRIHEVIESAPILPIAQLPVRLRRNTADETASRVLEDLDTALEEDEQYGFEQIREKVKAMNLSFRQYSPGIAHEFYERRPQGSANIEDVRRLAVSPPGTAKQAPILSEIVINDLKAIPSGHPINAVQELNELHRNDIETQRRKAEMEIRRARQVYTEDFFFDQTPEFERNSRTRTPEWKRRLVAKKMAVEAIRQHEERVLEEFYEWKRRYEPSYLEATYSPKGSARLPR